MKRIFHVLLLVSALFLSVLYVPLTSAGVVGYYAEVTITNTAGVNLTDYSVRIELNASSDVWGYGFDADSVYFTDGDGNPLWYYVEKVDADNKLAVLWVKVPSLLTNSSVTIYMYYGGENKYPDYSDPKQVFLFFDDASADNSAAYAFVGIDGGEGFTITWRGGYYEVSWTANGHGAFRVGDLSLDNFVITAEFNIPQFSSTANQQFGFVKVFDSYAVVARYGAYASADGFVDVFYTDAIPWSSVTEVVRQEGVGQVATNAWYRAEMRVFNDTVRFELSYNNIVVEASNATFAGVGSPGLFFAYDAGYSILFKDVVVRKYVEPEPAVSVGPSKVIEVFDEVPGSGAGAEESYWVREEDVRPVLSASDNYTIVKMIEWGGVPALYIRGVYGKISDNSSLLCQSWGGLRAYVPGFPEVKVSLMRLVPATVYVDSSVMQNLRYQIVTISHAGGDRVLSVVANIVHNPVDDTVYVEVVASVYNIRSGAVEWVKSLISLNSTTVDWLNSAWLSLSFEPVFYSITVGEYTTVVFGWRAVSVVTNGTNVITSTYTIAYETYTAPAPLSATDLARYVTELHGWYVWVGSGLVAYVNTFSVQYCVFVGDSDVSEGYFEYVMKYPLIKSLEPDVNRLWYLFETGQLPSYNPGIVDVVDVNWGALYAALIPVLAGVGFAMGLKSMLRRELGNAAALGAGLAMTALLAWMFGWTALEFAVLVVMYGLAIYLNT